MSIKQKRTLTEPSLAAHRNNARRSRGPATAEGKRRMRDAHLRHGFYAQDRDTALSALGEDPEEFAAVVACTWEQWKPVNGFEERLVMRLARAMWRMERADRSQEGLAIRMAQEANRGRQNRLHAQMTHLKLSCETVRILAQSVAREQYVTTSADLDMMKGLEEEGVMGEMGPIALALFRQLQIQDLEEPDADELRDDEDAKEFAKARRILTEVRASFGLAPFSEEEEIRRGLLPNPQKTQPLDGAPGTEARSTDSAEEQSLDFDLTPEQWESREPVRHLLENILNRQVELLEGQRLLNLRESVSGPSTYERAAEIAPTYPNAAFLRRMEDSSFREVWRITHLLLKIRREAPGQEVSVSNPESGEGHERTPRIGPDESPSQNAVVEDAPCHGAGAGAQALQQKDPKMQVHPENSNGISGPGHNVGADSADSGHEIDSAVQKAIYNASPQQSGGGGPAKRREEGAPDSPVGRSDSEVEFP